MDLADSVRDQWEMECPKCHSDQDIVIYATQAIEVKLVSDGTRDFNDAHDTEWEDDSRARCTDCGWDGRVCHLYIVSDEVKERQLENNWRYAVQCCETKLGFEAWKAEQNGGNPVLDPETPANSQPGCVAADSEWFIEGPGHTYWSVDKGWVGNFSDATMFTAAEKADCEGSDELPMEAKWVQNPVTVRKSGIVSELCDEWGIPMVNLPVTEEFEESAGYPYLGKSSVIEDDTCKASPFPSLTEALGLVNKLPKPTDICEACQRGRCDACDGAGCDCHVYWQAYEHKKLLRDIEVYLRMCAIQADQDNAPDDSIELSKALRILLWGKE